MKQLVTYSILILILLSGSQAKAQTKNAEIFDREEWKELSEGLDYTEKKPDPKPEDEDKKAKDSKPLGNINFSWVKWIFIGAGIILVSYILFLIGRQLMSAPTNQRIEDLSIEELEQNLEATDLDSALQKTLGEKSYEKAVRVAFLMILKELDTKDFITHKINKTNKIYSRELKRRVTVLQDGFISCSRIFERLIYSDTAIDESSYNYAKTYFDKYIHQVKSKA